MNISIFDLMQVPQELQDIDWLKKSLQAAIKLEFATVPIYLCGMWSIKDQDDPVVDMIKRIVIDEMFHMGLACNMLTSIGGTPEINTVDGVPTYPGHLPGDVRPTLEVALVGLSKEIVDTMYMQIEFPEGGPIALFRGRSFPTIGDFYDSILEAFRRLPASDITGARQVVPPGQRLFAIKTPDDVETAIDRIKRQGEGKSQAQSPFADDSKTELAHYYKFASIFHELHLVEVAEGKFDFKEPKIPFPTEIFPMAKVPPGGYPESEEFDKQFTTMLNQLQSAWVNGDANELMKAVRTMRKLDVPARELMQKPIPGGTGHFGPDFRLVT